MIGRRICHCTDANTLCCQVLQTTGWHWYPEGEGGGGGRPPSGPAGGGGGGGAVYDASTKQVLQAVPMSLQSGRVRRYHRRMRLQVEAGVDKQLVFGDPKSPRFVWWQGKLRPTPSGPDALTFDLLSIGGKLRAAFGAIGLKPKAPGKIQPDCNPRSYYRPPACCTDTIGLRPTPPGKNLTKIQHV